MKILYFVKHHKYIVGLLACVFILNVFVPISVKADGIVPQVSFSCFDSSESPIYTYTTDIGDFYTYLDLALQARSDLNLYSHSSDLKSALTSLGLSSFFTNWDPYNPIFYCNVGFTTRNGYNTFYFRFVKYNTTLDDYSLTVGSNYYNISSPYGFFPLSHRDFPSPFIINSISNHVVYHSGVGMDTDFYGTPVSYSNTVTLGYDSYSILNDSFFFGQAFDSFLNDSSQFVFGLFVVFDSSWQLTSRSSYFVNEFYRGFYPTYYSYDHYILNTYNTFTFDSSLFSFHQSGLFGGNYLSLIYYDYISSSPLSLDSFYIFANGLAVSGHTPSLPTPTPIPTQSWVTPSPFPTVTPLPLSPTPIINYIVPDVIVGIDGQDLNTSLTGYTSLADQVFSEPVFALGGHIIEYVYGFSRYFTYLLIIPILCLVAYVVGRLNQK